MIYIKRHNLCFLEVPKTASSSLRNFLARELYDPSEDIITEYNHYNSRFIIRNKLVPSNAKFFAVIREPLERQLSAYLYAHSRLLNNYPISFLPEDVDHFETICRAGFSDEIKLNFDLGLGKVAAAQQSSYINRNLKHEFWLYENLDTHIEDLKGQYNIRSDAYLDRINPTFVDKSLSVKSLIDVFYTDELKGIVRKQYADDVKLYDELKNGRYPK